VSDMKTRKGAGKVQKKGNVPEEATGRNGSSSKKINLTNIKNQDKGSHERPNKAQMKLGVGVGNFRACGLQLRDLVPSYTGFTKKRAALAGRKI